MTFRGPGEGLRVTRVMTDLRPQSLECGSVPISTHQVLPQLLVVRDDAVVNDDEL